MSAIFTARPSRPRWQVPAAVAFVLATMIGGLVDVVVPAHATGTGTIEGSAWHDVNRDGLIDDGEHPFAGHVLYLLDEAERYVAYAETATDGSYRFPPVAHGTYRVVYEHLSWQSMWDEWVPTTTGTLRPELVVEVAGPNASAMFGWRPIEHSSDVFAPLSEVRGAEGLLVQSYVDVVTAQELYDHMKSEFLIGDEAPHVIVRFGYSSSNTAQTNVGKANGVITDVTVTVYTSYRRWLTGGDWTLAHEYGHAWMNYHNYLVQQDIDDRWELFLTARGIDPDDDRLWSSHAWIPREIAAEDYRQLFASESARGDGQMNQDIPFPWEVDGFEDLLLSDFRTGGPQDEDGDEEAPEPDPIGDPDPVSEPGPEPEPEPLELTATQYKVRGVNHVDLTWNPVSGSDTEIYRDGVRVATVRGDHFTDNTGQRGSVRVAYHVCPTAGGACSTVVFAE